MGRKGEPDGPTLAEAWATLGERLGLQVETPQADAIRAQGTVRGRPVTVAIDREAARGEGWRFLFTGNTRSNRHRRDKWHTVLAVGCVNPSRLTGTIESAVDVNDPAWDPRTYDPRNGRSIRSDPPALAEKALDAAARERLMGIIGDLTVRVGEGAVVIEDRSTSLPESGLNYIAGSFVHQYQGPPPPMPERAVAGPPWWIDLLCDIADALDR